MGARAIHLPDKLAKQSQQIAKKIGLTRSQFIRQAIHHEIQSINKRLEQDPMIKSFKAMKESSDYLKEIENDLIDELPEDKHEWWK